jgi:hypothetical protein
MEDTFPIFRNLESCTVQERILRLDSFCWEDEFPP